MLSADVIYGWHLGRGECKMEWGQILSHPPLPPLPSLAKHINPRARVASLLIAKMWVREEFLRHSRAGIRPDRVSDGAVLYWIKR